MLLIGIPIIICIYCLSCSILRDLGNSVKLSRIKAFLPTLLILMFLVGMFRISQSYMCFFKYKHTHPVLIEQNNSK